MDLMRIHEMKERLTEFALCEVNKPKEHICTQELGAVIDMIKDLAEAEAKCYEAKLSKLELEMASDKDGEGDRMGYDNWRYSSGRFAPTGQGHRSGYTVPRVPRTFDVDMRGRMGYPMDMPSPWDRYQEAKRHYHETGSKQDKDEMSKSAKEHLNEAFDTMRDIWDEADPQMKQKMKADFQMLMNEMK